MNMKKVMKRKKLLRMMKTTETTYEKNKNKTSKMNMKNIWDTNNHNTMKKYEMINTKNEITKMQMKVKTMQKNVTTEPTKKTAMSNHNNMMNTSNSNKQKRKRGRIRR